MTAFHDCFYSKESISSTTTKVEVVQVLASITPKIVRLPNDDSRPINVIIPQLKEDKAYRDGGDALSAYVSDEEHQTLIGINDLTSDMDEQLGGLKTDLEMVTYDKALSAKEKETIINDAYKAKREALQEIVSALETELKRVEK